MSVIRISLICHERSCSCLGLPVSLSDITFQSLPEKTQYLWRNRGRSSYHHSQLSSKKPFYFCCTLLSLYNSFAERIKFIQKSRNHWNDSRFGPCKIFRNFGNRKLTVFNIASKMKNNPNNKSLKCVCYW